MRARGTIDAFAKPLLDVAVANARRSGDRRLLVGLLHCVARGGLGNSAPASRDALREAADCVDRTDTAMLAALIACTAEQELAGGNAEAAIGLWRQAASLLEETRPSYAALYLLNAGRAAAAQGNIAFARSILEHVSGKTTAGDPGPALRAAIADLERSAL